MSWQQQSTTPQPSITPQPSSTQQPAFMGGGPARSRTSGFPFDLRMLAGMTVMALGAGMFALGIFHGFENGSCSTTGYDANYGPVNQCAGGVGWWMLMLMVGLVVTGVGAAVARLLALAVPAIFVAVGAPFVVLAVHGTHGQLMLGVSNGTGKIYAGVFGGAFVVSGVVWGLVAARGGLSDLGAGSILPGLLGTAAGLAIAFLMAAGVSGAIGKTQSPQAAAQARSQQIKRSVDAAVAKANKAAAAQIQSALASPQLQSATKLSACISAAGTDTSKIQACVAKYTPGG